MRTSVFYIDVDRSQSVSAAHVGEAVVVSVARKFQRLVRAGDVVGRLGADQFALVTMQGLDAREVRLIADDLRATIKAGLNISGQDIVLTGSIGIASFDPQSPPASAGDLLADAEIAMQRARRAGPDRIETFTAAMRPDKDLRANMESDLVAAMERRQLKVLFQPILYLRTGTLAGFEAVARWDHPKLGPLDPADFAPLDDRSGFASRLGGYVLRAAVAEAQKWHIEHPRPEAPIFVSMNVARRQLFGNDLVMQVRSLLASGGLPKGALRIDVTEALVLDNPEQASALLRELTQAGARVSLDDFGAGYSSFSFLGTFAVDAVKIDAAFLHGASDGRAGTAMLRSLVALSHELGKTVVAKGADEEADLGLLRTVGCDFAQGSVSAGRHVTSREAMALVRHLRKTERRLKRTGLFRLRNRRIEDDAADEAAPRAVAGPIVPAGAPSAPTNGADLRTAVTSAASPPPPNTDAATSSAPQQALPTVAPPQRNYGRTTQRPRPNPPPPQQPAPRPAPQSSASGNVPGTDTGFDPGPAVVRQPSAPKPAQRATQPDQPSALATARATLSTLPPQQQLQPPAHLQAQAPQSPLPVSMDPQRAPSPAPQPSPPARPDPRLQPDAPAAPAARPLPPPVPPQASPSPATPMRPAAPMRPPEPVAAPSQTMIDRTLARLQAEIDRTMPDVQETSNPPIAPVRAVPTPPAPQPIHDVSSLPPALAESLARLAGRATDRRPNSDPPPPAAVHGKG